MNPYEIDVDKLKESKEVLDQKELIKMKLVATFLKATKEISSEEIIKATGIHKSDLSRLRSMNISRFTIDRIIGLLADLGFSTKIDVEPMQAS